MCELVDWLTFPTPTYTQEGNKIKHKNHVSMFKKLIIIEEELKESTKKKVLLRERKRHLARRVASARFADQSPDWGVPHPVLDRGGWYPIQSCLWGYPIQSWRGGIPSSPGQGSTPSSLGWGGEGTTSSLGWGGTPSSLGRGWGMGYPSSPGMGYPPSRPGMGYTPQSRTGMRYPPLISRMGPPLQTWNGLPLHLDLGWGTPPPRKCEQTKNISFPHPSDAGGKKWYVIIFLDSRSVLLRCHY